jgi:hypothetical protein
MQHVSKKNCKIFVLIPPCSCPSAELSASAGVGLILKQVGQNFFVKAMSQGGSAEACGKVKINDMLVAVNGRDVSNQITEASFAISTSQEIFEVRTDDWSLNTKAALKLDARLTSHATCLHSCRGETLCNRTIPALVHRYAPYSFPKHPAPCLREETRDPAGLRAMPAGRDP